jgi:hypothetical protein
MFQFTGAGVTVDVGVALSWAKRLKPINMSEDTTGTFLPKYFMIFLIEGYYKEYEFCPPKIVNILKLNDL